MKTSVEVQVLQWFERALAQKPEHRKLWLADQDMDQGVRDRVLRLLDADQAAVAFLEETRSGLFEIIANKNAISNGISLAKVVTCPQ